MWKELLGRPRFIGNKAWVIKLGLHVVVGGGVDCVARLNRYRWLYSLGFLVVSWFWQYLPAAPCAPYRSIFKDFRLWMLLLNILFSSCFESSAIICDFRDLCGFSSVVPRKLNSTCFASLQVYDFYSLLSSFMAANIFSSPLVIHWRLDSVFSV